MKRLVHSDCLSVLHDSKLVPTGSLGLVYLDPPYGTERLFSAGLRRSRSALAGQEPEAFDDHWDEYKAQVKLPVQIELVVKVAEGTGGRRLGTYVRYMAERLVALERGLSARASVYVHVSPPVAPYLRLVLDSVLGAQTFKNEVAWKRTHAHSSSKRFGPVHDTILFYARPGYQWHRPTMPADPAYFDKHYREVDEDGRRYQLVTCTGPGDRTGTGAHYEWRGQLPPPGRHWAWKRDEMERLEAVGRLRYSRNGVPRRVYYADEHQGVALQDIWTDIARLDSHSHERIGYDTQKPLALLERIVASSAPLDGELVFDGFAGTGTTLLAANAAGLGWIGCDSSLKAAALAIGRLGEAGIAPGAIDWRGGPSTRAEAEKLAQSDAEAFGVWATGMLGLLPDPKLHSRDVLFARSERGARAVAGARVNMTHLQTLADAPGATRYAVSVTPAPEHPEVHSVPVELIAASAARHRAPMGMRGRCGG